MAGSAPRRNSTSKFLVCESNTRISVPCKKRKEKKKKKQLTNRFRQFLILALDAILVCLFDQKCFVGMFDLDFKTLTLFHTNFFLKVPLSFSDLFKLHINHISCDGKLQLKKIFNKEVSFCFLSITSSNLQWETGKIVTHLNWSCGYLSTLLVDS